MIDLRLGVGPEVGSNETDGSALPSDVELSHVSERPLPLRVSRLPIICDSPQDEAQHLRSDVLEDLRLLTNCQMDSENRLTLLFVGHPELRRRLGLAAHEALGQRIVVRAHVPGLSRDELEPYLTHLLRRAGTELPLFEPAAIEAIFQATRALPRKINQLAHYALAAAAVAKAKSVSPEHVTAALAEVS